MSLTCCLDGPPVSPGGFPGLPHPRFRRAGAQQRSGQRSLPRNQSMEAFSSISAPWSTTIVELQFFFMGQHAVSQNAHQAWKIKPLCCSKTAGRNIPYSG